MQGLSEALAADFKAAQKERGMSAAKVANAFDKSPTSSWPYQLLEGNVPFTLPMVQMWHSLTGARHFMRWVGDLCDHVVAPKPAAKRSANTARSLHAYADYLTEISKADADGKISDQEAHDIEARGMEVMSAILGDVEYYRERAKAARSGRVTSLREAS
jgi:hypothetical protein